MDVSVVVGTFGDRKWAELARSRAIPSVPLEIPVIHIHAGSLAEARNHGLAQVTTEFVIHLDADDELEPGYIEAMGGGTADLRAPAVRYVRHGRPRQCGVPRVAGHRHDCIAECLREGNFVAIGALARTDMLREAGGWEEWPVYEDWALWLRCWKAGATVESIPEAVYRAHVRFDSRNRGPAIRMKNRVHYEIVDAILPAAA